ncbi:MAG: hypothetical protein IJC09_03260 [Clostridia bacterium]|nr:hypothetical protein [Clostridia bacterium]
MKKVISFLIVIMMMSTTVLADTADGLRGMLAEQAQLESFETKTVLTAKLNKPLEVIEYIPADEDFDVDYSMLIGDLIKSKATIECAFNVSEDYKKIQMSISTACDIPVHINDGLKFDAYAKSGIWYNYDVTDAQNPVFTVISKSPIEPYYEFFDLIKESGMDFSSVINADVIKDAIDGLVTAIENNADITRTAKGYTVNFDDAGFAGFIRDCAGMAETYITDDDIKEALKEVSVYNNFDVIGEDGITLQITKNANGNITAYAEKVHIDFNLFDLLASIGMSTDGLERDKSQIDITFEAVSEISGHNRTTVAIPELTKDNSRHMYEYHYGEGYYYPEKSPVFEDNKIYYPMNEIIELCEIGIVIDGNKVISGDAVFECDQTQLIMVDDEPYVTEDVLEFIGLSYVDVNYDVNQEKFKYYFIYTVPDAPEEDEYDDFYEDYYDAYESRYLRIGFDINRAPYADKGIYFMPVYEFVCGLGNGEFEYGYKSLKYTATNENTDGIKTLLVKDGDSFVTVNGEKIAIEKPAVEVDGVLNIPVSFVRTYGYSAEIRSNFSVSADGYAHTTYSFTKENPLYVEVPYEAPYLYVDIVSDQMPYVDDGKVFVPLYDLLYGMYEGEFSFTENGMEYVATEDNDYGIKKVSVAVGDDFVVVDDEKVGIENKVVRVNDIIRVPLAFTEALGFETEDINIYGSETWFSFSIPNPNYTE